MSRKILYRGQTRRKGEYLVNYAGDKCDSNWVYGGIFPQNEGGDKAIIYQQEPKIEKFVVYADTVCEYTGMTDKNNAKIFENDILEFTNKEGDKTLYLVLWSEQLAGWVTRQIDAHPVDDPMAYWVNCQTDYEIVGNVFDNPELLEVK